MDGTINPATLVAAVEQAGDAVVITNAVGLIQYVNPAFTATTGYSRVEAVGQNPRFLKSGRQSSAFYKQLWDTVTSGQRWHGEVVNRRKDGTLYLEEMRITPVRDASGAITSFIAIKHDVTERRASDDAKAFLAAIVQSSEDAIVACTRDGIIRIWNPGSEALLGFKRDEVVGQPATAFVAPESRLLLADCIRRVAGGESLSHFEVVCVHRDGRIVNVSLSGSPIKDSDGHVTDAVAIMHDVTQRKLSEEALLFKTALLEGQTETTLDGILVVDESNRVVLANRQFGEVFEIPAELIKAGNDVLIRKYAAEKVQDTAAFSAKVAYLYDHPEEKSRDEIRFKNGTTYDRYSAPLRDPLGRHRGRIWYFRDITDRKKAEERVQFLAFHDGLTGLPKRALLQDRLTTALAGARRRHEKLALLFIDLDRFKNINDTFGHPFGDEVLKEVARRLQHWCRDQDTVARISGDEFIVMLNGVKDSASVAIAAERLQDVMKAEFLVHGKSLKLGCSIGVSIFPEHGQDGKALIKNADEALYAAKDMGRGMIRFFTGKMDTQAAERTTLESNLRLALDREEFFLMYQPQMNIQTGLLTGFEALIRWQQPQLGLIPPDRFISIAENCGLILPIGEWVLRTACAQARRWLDSGLVTVPVAVNVSAVQFRQPGFPALIQRVLFESGLPARFLDLEITEGLLLSEKDLSFSVLRALKEMGVKLAIDDFGIGFSSLSYLKRFRVDKLKIDRSFVRDLAVDSDDAAIVVAILAMARSLKLKVIAEGVENEGQLSFLRRQGCDEIQGYYLSKPIAADELLERLPILGVPGGLSPMVAARPRSVRRFLPRRVKPRRPQAVPCSCITENHPMGGASQPATLP